MNKNEILNWVQEHAMGRAFIVSELNRTFSLDSNIVNKVIYIVDKTDLSKTRVFALSIDGQEIADFVIDASQDELIHCCVAFDGKWNRIPVTGLLPLETESYTVHEEVVRDGDLQIWGDKTGIISPILPEISLTVSKNDGIIGDRKRRNNTSK
jgi:hypothetical protein